MDNFFLKIVIGISVVVAAIVLAISFWPESKPTEPQKGFYDVVREDRKRLSAEPDVNTVKKLQQRASGQQGQPADTSKPVFKPLAPEEELHAQQLLEYALSFRSMGRLPKVNYKPMIDTCRQIIELYPDSEYAYKAKRILGDIPANQRRLYNVTEDEIIVE